MKIIHRVMFDGRHHAKAGKKLRKLGIQLRESGRLGMSVLYYFDVSEDDALWPDVKEILSKAKIGLEPSRTVFTKKEIAEAEWVRVGPDFIYGYPMPDLDGSYKEVSFAPESECPECGLGMQQVGPIHMKREPKLGKRDFMAINWTFDYFARPEVFDIMREKGIEGVEPMDAIHHRLRTPLQTVKQLKIVHQHCPSIIDDNLVRDENPCGHVKYNVLTRGMMIFSRDAFNDVPDLMKTHEWFGSWHQAFQLVLASPKFVRLYMDRKWKGLSLDPIELV